MSTLRGFFDRLSGDGTLEKDEIARYLSKLGVGDGWLGQVKVKAAVQIFLRTFDKAPKDGGVRWSEVTAYTAKLIPRPLRAPSGGIDLAAAEREFRAHADAQGRVDEARITAYARGKLPAVIPTNLAEALARLMLDALDGDGDGHLTWPDYAAALTELNRELA